VTVYWGTSLSPSWTVDMSHAAHVELWHCFQLQENSIRNIHSCLYLHNIIMHTVLSHHLMILVHHAYSSESTPDDSCPPCIQFWVNTWWFLPTMHTVLSQHLMILAHHAYSSESSSDDSGPPCIQFWVNTWWFWSIMHTVLGHHPMILVHHAYRPESTPDDSGPSSIQFWVNTWWFWSIMHTVLSHHLMILVHHAYSSESTPDDSGPSCIQFWVNTWWFWSIMHTVLSQHLIILVQTFGVGMKIWQQSYVGHSGTTVHSTRSGWLPVTCIFCAWDMWTAPSTRASVFPCACADIGTLL
jgi:hypothetical protein